MKLNEPVRAGGIGRKQIAWNTDKNISEQSILEEAANDPSSTSAHSPVSTLAETMKFARVAAYSAASSAVVQGQNEVWGVQGIEDFIVESSNSGFGYVKWQKKGSIYNYDWAQVNNPFMYVDSEDSSKIWVNKPGWWLVDALVEITNYKNSQNYKMDVVSGGGDDVIIGFDSVHTNEYPTLRVNALVPVPALNSFAEWPPYFQIRFRVVGLNANQTLQGNGFIHAIWMKPFEYNESHGIA